jgi:hypothetical protein
MQSFIMLNTQRLQTNQILRRLAESLDISESRYLQAKERYQAVGKWLEREESTISKHAPVIYPQGSFALGTVVKPFTNREEYDIDLVSELNLKKSEITQKQLKSMVGYEIRQYAKANNMNSSPEEGRRCWTLHYADGAQFHMDILPALPDEYFKQKLLEHRSSEEFADGAIAITDNTLPNYSRLDSDWPKSNPKGYAAWFKRRMESQFTAQKQMLAESLRAKVDDVPEYKVKTPLQISIQLLKRHRDIMFKNDPEDKPISIIITTLAAKAYRNEADLVEALSNIVQDMPSHIQTVGGRPWISNPVNPEENFADKWKEHPQRKTKFEKWLKQVQSDLERVLEEDDLRALGEFLEPRFGKQAVNESLKPYSEKDDSKKSKTWGLIPSLTNLKNLLNVSHREKPKWPIALQGDVHITGWASQNGFRPWQIESNSAPLSKHCSLRFKATTNVSRPYKVYWQVVNTGAEAAADNCLRGGYYHGLAEKGGRVREEGTLYTGTHWIECFIIKNGACVARSGEFIVNIQ